jgi:histidine triad (HIT) family protein
MASIFTRIVNGEIPAHRVYEDDQTLAFLDINPASHGHTLVIPKQEFADLLTTPPELLAAVALTSQKVARAIMAALQPDGINIVQNNGAAAGQVVFHYHMHVIPRWQGDRVLPAWQPGAADADSLAEIARRINAQFSTGAA